MKVRWNSAQSMMTSLLRVKTALKSVASDFEDFPEEFIIIGERSFWKKFTTAEAAIVPLNKASFMIQENATRMSYILMVHGQMSTRFKGIIPMELLSLGSLESVPRTKNSLFFFSQLG